MDQRTYRMTFGRHKGETLQDLPRDYRQWLINDRVYDGKPALEAALRVGNYLQNTPDPFTPPSTPKRKGHSNDFDDTDLPISIARKRSHNDIAKRNGTMLNYDGTAYVLDFGKYHGERLRDVPPSYIDWLIEEGAHNDRSDLAAALREEGMLPPITGHWASPSRYVELPVTQATYGHSARVLFQPSGAETYQANPQFYPAPH